MKEFIDNFKQLSSVSVQRIHKDDLETSRENGLGGNIAHCFYIPNLKALNFLIIKLGKQALIGSMHLNNYLTINLWLACISQVLYNKLNSTRVSIGGYL